MNSSHRSRFPYRVTSRRPSRHVLTTVAAAAVLGVALAGCAGPDRGKSTTANEVNRTGTKVLWAGDSIAGAEGPALGAALKASSVEFKDASSDGGGTVVAGGEEITKTIAADTWKQLSKNVESFQPTVVAYQITTYDWGTQDQQRAAYEKLVTTAKAAGAKTVFVPAPPIKIDDFYKKYASQMRTAPQVAMEVAKNSGGAAVFLDASQLWGIDASAKKAQRASDGIHNCQQGAVAFAAWFATELGKKEGFTPAAVDTWAKGSWTSDDRYATLKCDG
ncbi:SGNH/GDSL hydrolase family protein [Streptomyces sp. NBC_00885]|uniref:SGNH/GDSL hydrolase family protein n=1 Tax=Streptomyces sp. NBC_00885 TaxID=2975857 RepID=UPI003869CED1|nr:SGNH/GDSL hydrolase family protein [Streptomyces sp. NBC_00885]